ncbi:MAG: hypothetical protein IT371_28725 [Deltaproteobacteria bacterium]|nr:hypothetical protein [Deltaproteobacteria bacterium]
MTKRAQVGSALQSIVNGTARGALALALSLAFVGCEGMVGAGDEENLSRQGQSGAKQVLGGLCDNNGDCGVNGGEELVCRNQGHGEMKMCLPKGKHGAFCAGPFSQQDGWCKSGACVTATINKYCKGPNESDTETKWPDRAVSVPEGQKCRVGTDTCLATLACRTSADEFVNRCRPVLPKGSKCGELVANTSLGSNATYSTKAHPEWCASGQCGCVATTSASECNTEDYKCLGEGEVPAVPGSECTACHTVPPAAPAATPQGQGKSCTVGAANQCQSGLTCKAAYQNYGTCECNPGCTGTKVCTSDVERGVTSWSCTEAPAAATTCKGIDNKDYAKDAWSPYGQCGTGTKCGRAKCKADGTWDTSHCLGGDADADKKCGTNQFCSAAGSCTAKTSSGQCTRPAECTSGKCEPPYGGSATNYCVNAPAAPAPTDEIDASTFDSRSRKADETCYNTDDCQQGLSCAKHGSEKTCGCSNCSGDNDTCELTTTPKVWACNHGAAPAQEPVQAQGQGQTAGDATCPTGRSMPNNPHPVGQHLADGSWVFAAPGKYEMGNIAPGTACDYTCWGKGYAWNEPTPGSWQFCYPDPSAAGGGRFSTPKARGSQSLGGGMALGLDADEALRASEAGVSGSCAVSGSPTQMPAWFALITLLGLVSLLRRRD